MVSWHETNRKNVKKCVYFVCMLVYFITTCSDYTVLPMICPFFTRVNYMHLDYS